MRKKLKCCDEHGCFRSQPFLLEIGGLSNNWYVISDYVMQDDVIFANKKHLLPPDTGEHLSLWHEAMDIIRHLASDRAGQNTHQLRAQAQQLVNTENELMAKDSDL